jgi:hypothetical protein
MRIARIAELEMIEGQSLFLNQLKQSSLKCRFQVSFTSVKGPHSGYLIAKLVSCC